MLVFGATHCTSAYIGSVDRQGGVYARFFADNHITLGSHIQRNAQTYENGEGRSKFEGGDVTYYRRLHFGPNITTSGAMRKHRVYDTFFLQQRNTFAMAVTRIFKKMHLVLAGRRVL